MSTRPSDRRFRIAVAGFKLESVTFLPKLTSLTDFQGAQSFGTAIIETQRGANTPIGGFISVCEPADVELLPVVYAEVGAAGPASEEAFEHYLSIIVSGLAGQALDGVLLDLHGAMTTPHRLDADGAELLRDPDRGAHLIRRARLAAAHGVGGHGIEVALEVGLADLAIGRGNFGRGEIGRAHV